MSTGTVKKFNAKKGYGFITADGENNEDLFVHFSAIEMEGFKVLKEGQRVSFTLSQTHKGAQATEVKVIEEVTT